MTKKKNLLIPLCIFIPVLYIILAARPLATELQFLPQWTIDAATPTYDKNDIPEGAFENAIPFKLAQTLGYFTPDGNILTTVTFPYKAALSPSHYALYGTNDKKIQVFNADGSKAGIIQHTGFPFFMEDKQYLFLPGGSSFSQLGKDGSVEWTYEGYAPLTAFSSSLSGCVAGFADGTITSFDNDGNIDQTFTPSGSTWPVILGAAISNSGDLIACICGQGEQRFIVAKKSAGHTTIIHHEYFEHDVTRQLLVKFSKDGKTVYYDSGDGLGVVDCTTGKSKKIKTAGTVLSIQESADSKAVFVLSRDGDTCAIQIIEPFATYAGVFRFTAQSAFIAVHGADLFVGHDNTISKLNVVHR